ncbi:hypothetical protein JCM10296v2_003697 [Rhodotorula toruloides]
MPPTTRRASAAQNAPAAADDAQAAPDGVRRADEGGGDEGGKKRKTSATAKKGKAKDEGKVKRDLFSTLPLDIVLQIAGYLDPGTLLAIGQTSKSIRSTLFRKSAQPNWVAARRKVGLKDLHELMAEPRYAFLLYGKACEVCGSTRRQSKSRFDLQVRACSKCLENNICLASTIEEEVGDVHPLTFQCCLSTPYSHAGKRSVSRKPFYWYPDAHFVSTYLHQIDPVAARTDRTKIHPSDAAIAFQADCDAFKTVAEADVSIFGEGVKLVDEAKLADEQERPKLRFRQIQIRLMLAGFDKVDTLATPIWVQNSSRTVDNEYWAQVKDRVIRAVQKAHDERVDRERIDRKKQLSRLHAQLYDASSSVEQEFFPGVHAFLRLPSIEVLWQPENTVISMSSWAALTPKIRLDIQRQARIDKIRYSHQLARALPLAGIVLPSYISDLVSAEPSPFLDEEDQSKGFAPLHDCLTDQQLSLFLDNPLALFTCTACGLTCHVKKTGPHFQAGMRGHCLWGAGVYVEREAPEFQPSAASSYLQLLHGCIIDAGFDIAATTCADLAELGFHFEVQLESGSSILVDWEALSTGKHTDRRSRRAYT